MDQDLSEVLTEESSMVARRTMQEMLERVKKKGKEAIRKESITLELEVRRKDGSTVWTESSLHFLADETGRPGGIVGVTRDIERRKRAEEELRRMNEELERRVEERTGELIAAHADIRALRELLPICSSCKRIRDASGNWHVLETYLEKHRAISFTHGLCPQCYRRARAGIPGLRDDDEVVTP